MSHLQRSAGRFQRNVWLPGRPVLTALRASHWLYACMSKQPQVVDLAEGVKVKLAPKLMSHGSTSIFMKRAEYEPELRYIARFAEVGSTAVDVGANIGIYTLFLSRYLGPSGHVFAFEPSEISYPELVENLTRNQVTNVTASRLALSDRAGTAALFQINGSPVNFSLAEEAHTDTETVSVTMLDAFLQEPPTRLSFMKIDVEGFEYRVLQGARNTLERHRPTVMFEVSDSAMARANTDRAALENFFRRLGYRLFVFDEDGGLQELETLVDANVIARPGEALHRP
ncbi:FkbM family methyltransferase [Siccirubricoccus sp. KC 17139]|uniref:FkbM family methyltransferase n=1 Tax=Siccirubricoccus soli TaxID=2899147 RepID=A0ABT1D4Z1_9PROT|nr:FkbM family methyltransferase [Siccirubricoccus soli]MCO6416055.1 FkbM family methyltransferase [Siccirubricoccus soli]MCP2682187.1 FkbM family methyltransferase [Siccirubricoccus soli]